MMRITACLLALCLSAAPAAADTIRIVIPYAPGGALDPLARILANGLGKLRTGDAIVVENIGGAGGIVGMSTVAKAPPDGRTFLFSPSGNIVISPWLQTHALRRHQGVRADRAGWFGQERDDRARVARREHARRTDRALARRHEAHLRLARHRHQPAHLRRDPQPRRRHHHHACAVSRARAGAQRHRRRPHRRHHHVGDRRAALRAGRHRARACDLRHRTLRPAARRARPPWSSAFPTW